MNQLKGYLEKALGITDLKNQLQKEIDDAKEKLEKIKEETTEALAEKDKITKSPKDLATDRGEPWVSVLDTHISDKNASNGYFELDWNHHFIEFLIENGYGYENDPEEEIVDRWFRSLAYNMLAEAEQPITEHTTGGFINLKRISDDHSEAS